MIKRIFIFGEENKLHGWGRAYNMNGKNNGGQMMHNWPIKMPRLFICVKLINEIYPFATV